MLFKVYLSIKLKGHVTHYSFVKGKNNPNENGATIIREQIKTEWGKEKKNINQENCDPFDPSDRNQIAM